VLISKHATAATACPSITAKRVTPHTLRHTNTMLPKAKGADIATIALWLGHESTQTTHIYKHTDPAPKEQTTARTTPLSTKPSRYRPSNPVLTWPQTP
jgi:site-specific recombinase XerD